MKSFFLKILLFAATVSTIVILFLEFYGAYVDYFYNKFVSPPQHSMIVGDSKSLMGIQPAVMTEKLKGSKFEMPMYNFSFTIAQAAYGQHYLNSIKNKLDPDTKNGLFFLSVGPWVVSERENDDIKNGIYFEQDGPPHNMRFLSMRPNPEYVFKNFNFFHLEGVLKRDAKIHEDGWLEKKDPPMDSVLRKNLNRHYDEEYPRISKIWKHSAYRLGKLEETVSYLKKHGTVILLRMPSSKKVVAMEEAYWKNFDGLMESMAKRNNVRYINYSKSGQFVTFDGVHMDIKNGALFSAALCDSVR